MGKGKLELLLLAAMLVGPQLIEPSAEAAQVKQVEQLSAEELSTLEKPANYCVYSTDAEGSDS
jgi:hypothetical protein